MNYSGDVAATIVAFARRPLSKQPIWVPACPTWTRSVVEGAEIRILTGPLDSFASAHVCPLAFPASQQPQVRRRPQTQDALLEAVRVAMEQESSEELAMGSGT